MEMTDLMGYSDAAAAVHDMAGDHTPNIAVRNTARALRVMVSWAEAAAAGSWTAELSEAARAGMARVNSRWKSEPDGWAKSPLQLAKCAPGLFEDTERELSLKSMRHPQRCSYGFPGLGTVIRYSVIKGVPPGVPSSDVEKAFAALAAMRTGPTSQPAAVPEWSAALRLVVRVSAQSLRRAESVMGPRSEAGISEMASSISGLPARCGALQSAVRSFLSFPRREYQAAVERSMEEATKGLPVVTGRLPLMGKSAIDGRQSDRMLTADGCRYLPSYPPTEDVATAVSLARWYEEVAADVLTDPSDTVSRSLVLAAGGWSGGDMAQYARTAAFRLKRHRSGPELWR